MSKNILELNLNKHISFKDIPEDDIFSRYSSMYIPYDKSESEIDKIQYNNFMYIREKYGLSYKEYADVWVKKMSDIMIQFDINDIYDEINYAKKTIKELCWEKYFHIFYNDFLRSIILDEKWYREFIMKNKDMFNFLEKELRDLFKYSQISREDRIWFVIDELYGYHSNSRHSWKDNEKLDNMWSIDRYGFWRKYKEKWIVKENNND